MYNGYINDKIVYVMICQIILATSHEHIPIMDGFTYINAYIHDTIALAFCVAVEYIAISLSFHSFLHDIYWYDSNDI